jgi:S-adenosylmethionine:tRNA ribosyltransferase-isomerase
MDLSDFDYKLPKNFIAQRPVEPRDSSKLMVIKDDQIIHKTFRNLKDFLDNGDVLVVNDSKVLRARLLGRKETGGAVDLLIVRSSDEGWECLIKGKNIKRGTRLFFGEDILEGIVRNKMKEGKYTVNFSSPDDVEETIQKIGLMPTPPYIKEILREPEKYQTVYADKKGSIAAPTAGLHFTEAFLDELKMKEIEIVSLTLHVGTGTFLPVKNSNIIEHKMEAERFSVDGEAAGKINQAKKDGRKVIAVGTTTVKMLESSCNKSGIITEKEGKSDLFIYPGYDFKFGLDGMLTNFHLPKSTLIMLVSAFFGRERILNAYNSAIEHKYRFYSFGDAMLLLK